MGCGPWGREESDTTERLPFHFSLFEREPAASVVRANLVSRVILIFRINQATQLFSPLNFPTEISSFYYSLYL